MSPKLDYKIDFWRPYQGAVTLLLRFSHEISQSVLNTFLDVGTFLLEVLMIEKHDSAHFEPRFHSKKSEFLRHITVKKPKNAIKTL